MGFITDNQTLEDLKLLGKRSDDSVRTIFDRTHSRGGAELLEELFHYPLSDAAAIRHRTGIIQYFAASGTAFPFESELFDLAEQYLANADERTRLSREGHTLGSRFTQLIGADTEYMNLYKGVMAVLKILHTLRLFLGSGEADEPAGAAGDTPYSVERDTLLALLNDAALEGLMKEPVTKHGADKLPYEKVADYDGLLRFRHREALQRILRHIYYLDVYISVARVASERGFVFAEVLPGEQRTIRMEGLYHPLLKNPVPNTLEMTAESNVLFLTGANMAGKSTFMKALGISLFLAHMGFPVPARKAVFSVFDGIYSTINLPDNLGMGASHFYAEVLRVKKVARDLSLSRNLFVLFDEMFRGTNVKDAYEATVAIVAAFAQKRGSFFVISTHITEAGEVLRERCGNIGFRYLPTRMEGSLPVYTYTLEEGITADRHGMVIVKNEGILDILNEGSSRDRRQTAKE
jgi:DNA mismatch repair protein MutS